MTPTAALRVAVAQVASRSGDIDANATRAAEAVDEAAAGGARVLVLPELFLPGYDLAALAADPGLDLEDADDARLEPVRRACRRTGTLALLSVSTRTGTTRSISILVVDAAGGVVKAYDKQHLPADEATIFTAGDHGAVLEVDGWMLGLGVCYDGCFPEHARRLADAGAWAYLVPTAYVVGAEHRRDLYYAARALDNGIYVVMAGLVGTCGVETFGGGSVVRDPEGRRVAGVADGEEGLVFADLDPQAVVGTRDAHRMGRDRLPELGPVAVLPVR